MMVMWRWVWVGRVWAGCGPPSHRWQWRSQPLEGEGCERCLHQTLPRQSAWATQHTVTWASTCVLILSDSQMLPFCSACGCSRSCKRWQSWLWLRGWCRVIQQPSMRRMGPSAGFMTTLKTREASAFDNYPPPWLCEPGCGPRVFQVDANCRWLG